MSSEIQNSKVQLNSAADAPEVSRLGQMREKTVQMLNSGRENLNKLGQAGIDKAKELATKAHNLETNAIDSTVDTHTKKTDNKLSNLAIDLGEKSAKIVDTKIEFFNNGERKFFEKVGSETHKVVRHINKYKNSAAEIGDKISRGAARGTRILARSILRPILSLGFTFRAGEVAAEGIAAGLTALVRGIGAAATAFFTYLPELLVATAIIGTLVGIGIASPIAGGVIAATLALTTGAVVAKQVRDSKEQESEAVNQMPKAIAQDPVLCAKCQEPVTLEKAE